MGGALNPSYGHISQAMIFNSSILFIEEIFLGVLIIEGKLSPPFYFFNKKKHPFSW
jgi:hypothetical protein